MLRFEEIGSEVPLEYLGAGLCVLPASSEMKRPIGVKWSAYRDHRPSETDIRIWFRPGMHVDAVAMVCGLASAGKHGELLFCADCDDPDPRSFDQWFASVKAADAALAESLTIEKTPGGEGKRHIFWRAPVESVGNAVFARYADGRIRFESRFEGGLVIVSPSKSGGYKLVQGSFATIPTITRAQHELLIELMRSLDESVRPEPVLPPAWEDVRIDADDTRPGSDFNRRGSEDFLRLMQEHGWKILGKRGTNVELQRPGKDGRGLSATFNGSCVFNFSTNAAPFAAGKGYSPFHAYTLVAHGGDFRAAAAALSGMGYGGLAAVAQSVETVNEVPDEVEAVEEVDDPGPIDPDLLDATGLIREIAAFTDRTSPRQNPLLSRAGAIAIVAHLAGLARCQTQYGDRPNLFQLCLAPSASGKSFAMRTNRRLAQALGIGNSIATNLASGPGLEDAFIKSPKAVLATIDEFQKLLAAMRSRDSALANGTAKTLLEFYSAANDIYYTRKLALPANGRQLSSRPDFFDCPHLTVHACGISEFVFQNLSVDNLADGLLGRFLLFETEDRGALSEDGRAAELPDEVLERMARLIAGHDIVEARQFSRRMLQPSGVLVGLDGEADGYRKELAVEADRLFEVASGDNRESARSLWGRSFEKAMKLALVFAVSAAPDQPVITKEILERAWRIAEHSTRRLLFLAESFTARNAYDEMAKRVIRHLREYGRPMAKSVLIRKMRESVRDLDQVLETLVESRQIVAKQAASGGGRKPTMIALAGWREDTKKKKVERK